MTAVSETVSTKQIKFCVCYNLFVNFILILFGAICIYWGKTLKTNDQSYEISHLNQIARDWQQAPFVNIKVVESSACPENHSEIIENIHFWGNWSCIFCLQYFKKLFDKRRKDTWIDINKIWKSGFVSSPMSHLSSV